VSFVKPLRAKEGAKLPAEDVMPEEVDEGMVRSASQLMKDANDLALFKGMKAFVAGASGGTGKKIVEQLVALGVPVVALVRDKSKASGGLLADGVTLVEGDVYQYQTLPMAMKDCNVVICATGSRPALDPLGPFNVDYQGTKNLVTAALRADVKHFTFVTSIGTDDILFPLNLFWGVLFWKKRAEEVLQRSGLEYTIVRPGGLKDELKKEDSEGQIVMAGPDAYGLPPRKQPGSILREQVAEVCIASLVEPSAANKIVEIVASKDAPKKSLEELFMAVHQ